MQWIAAGRSRALGVVCLLAAWSWTAKPAQAQIDAATRELSRSIFQQLIEINTTDSSGSTTVAAEAMAARLREAGFAASDIVVLGPNPRKGNLVARLHGTGKHKPVLLIGHLDVVEARREDWTTDPFKFLEKDGYFYGRGTEDMKESDAILMTTMIRMKQKGFLPDRDIILALTADEEGGQSNGVAWLLANHRDLVDAEFVLNPDGGGVDTQNGKALEMTVDASEKLYADYQWIAKNKGGHSSLPEPDNAIYHLANALVRLENSPFPVELNAVTRAYFERMSQLDTSATGKAMKELLQSTSNEDAVKRLSADPLYNSTMRTTCVATRLNAGHANNALPQMAQANINCRILPGHSREEVRQELARIANDPKVAVNYMDEMGDVHETAPSAVALPPAALRTDVQQSLHKIVALMWPGIPIIPTMSTGASDGVHTNAAGMPTYGISGVAIDTDDVRAHGRDERVPVESYYRGVDFYYRLVTDLTGGGK